MTHRKQSAYQQLRRAAYSLTARQIQECNLEALIVLDNGITGNVYFEPTGPNSYRLESIYWHGDGWVTGSHLEWMHTFHIKATA